MTADFTPHYRSLGLTPGADWDAIKKAYRSLTKKWHPDRFPHDTQQYAQAEERFKEITRSYRILETHYRQFGFAKFPEKTASAESEPGAEGPPGSEPRGQHHVEPTSGHRRLRSAQSTVLALSLVGATLLSIFVWPENEAHRAPAADEITQLQFAAPNQADHSSDDAVPAFTTGSTLGEVYSIQGIPTRTEGEIWYYGNSVVRFSRGVVVGWENDTGNPLRVRTGVRELAIDRPVAQLRRGLTKSEVRSMQGSPTRETEMFWEYGASRIYFENGRTVRWEESPLDPLKTRK